MIIALDYDDTYTRDPELWDKFILDATNCGHTVFCVTMRYYEEGRDVIIALSDKVEDIFFTGRKAKQKFMFDLGYNVQVWIDDNPGFVIYDAAS